MQKECTERKRDPEQADDRDEDFCSISKSQHGNAAGAVGV